MSAHTTGDGWAPAVRLDLATAGAAAFNNVRDAFADWSKSQPPLGPVLLRNGWHDITPQIAEDLLRRNTANRKPSFATVKKYAKAMKTSDWRPTGQPILINERGKLEDAAHRLWASYLGMVGFRSYVISDVPFFEDLFAYIDDSRPRNAGDALYTSGTNGLSNYLATAIKLAGRYDDGTLDAFKQPRGSDLSVREILAYARHNPDLSDVGHLVIAEHPQAVEAIGNKPVAIFFAWKVQQYYGDAALIEFLEALISDAEADSPIEGYRARLLRAERQKDELGMPHRLALLIKAFLLHRDGKKLSKRGLFLTDTEGFPVLEPAEPLARAAE